MTYMNFKCLQVIADGICPTNLLKLTSLWEKSKIRNLSFCSCNYKNIIEINEKQGQELDHTVQITYNSSSISNVQMYEGICPDKLQLRKTL